MVPHRLPHPHRGSGDVSLPRHHISPATGLTRGIIHGILAIASGLALILAGAPIFRKSLVPRITLEQLFLIGLCGSFAASLYSTFTGIGHVYYEVVIILLAIYHLGQLITRSQIKRLESLENEIPGLRCSARLAGESTEIPIANIRAGQLLEVRPGEVIPADGVIENGSAFVEKLIHTGEPFPAPVCEGEKLLAGCRVLDGALLIRATAAGTDRELDRLLAVCKTSSSLPTESLAAAVLRFFVPSVIVISILTVVVWIALGETSQALFNGLAVTIVACPCGIGLAIPVTLRRSHAQLRLLGLIPHVPDFLERLAAIQTIFFDKTGTLTSSDLSIESIDISQESPPELLSWLTAIQRQSSHPVAKPFWNLTEPAQLSDVIITPIPARGITASFSADANSHEVTICNSLHLADLHPELPLQSIATRALHIILDGRITGNVILREASREGALKTIENLKASGYDVEILTGDSQVSGDLRESVSCHIGLTTARKASIIQKHESSGRQTLVIGDGLNDTEAMSAAHASIALGSAAKAASSVASATLSHYDLSVISQALHLAKTTRKRLTQLLAFTLIYNFIGIALACAGLIHPVSAAILMLASSATVLFMANRGEPQN